MPPGLTVHVADDLDALAIVAAELLAQPTGTVLEREWIVVPSAPVRQWLDWRLAESLGTSGADRSDGIAANFTNLFPEEFVRRIERTALDSAGDDTWTSWDIDALTVRILGTTSRSVTVPDARSLAQDIDNLVRWRPDVVRGHSPPTRAAEEALHAYHELAPAHWLPHAQRDRVIDALAHGRPPTMPTRVIIFGLASVPGGPAFCQLVRDLARTVEVVILLTAVPGSDAIAFTRDTVDTTPRAAATWAHESDTALLLWREVAPRTAQWTIHSHGDEGHSVLAQTRRALGGVATTAVDSDTSVQFVGACGIDRQVEQLRDVILTLLDRSGLEPTDVLVASPDPGAVMDAIERHWLLDADDRHLPRLPADPTVQLARHRRSRLDASVAMLAAARSRCRTSDVLSLLSFPSIAGTLGIDQRGRDRVAALAASTHVTVGLSPHHREPFAIYGEHSGLRPDAGTWQRFFDRIVATSLVGHDGSSAAVGVPDDVDLLASLHPLVRTLDEMSDSRTTSASVGEWLTTLTTWMTTLTSDERTVDGSFADATRRLARALNSDPGPALFLDDFAQLWSLIARESSRQRVFGHGGVTVTDLDSLAYAPHRIVCLVGLDDHRMPAGSWPSAVLGERRMGDPDPRGAALAAIRAAVATARDAVVVTFTDRRLDDGRSLDLPVVVDELRDVVATAAGVDAASLTVTSARHASSIPTGIAHLLEDSWDPRAAGLVTATPPVLAVRDDIVTTVSWRDLRSFSTGPVAHFLRRSWRADLPEDPSDDPDAPPLSLDPLLRSQIQRAFVWGLVDALQRTYGDGPLPPMPGESVHHSGECDEDCAWLHGLVRDLVDELTHDESLNANVPPRLWRHRLQVGHLTLAAYNLARDLDGWHPYTRDELVTVSGDVVLPSGATITTALLRDLPPPLTVVGRGTDLALVSLDVRHGGAREWRRLLRTVVDVAVLAALAPGLTVRAQNFFVPKQTDRYKQSSSRYGYKKDHFAGNPRATLRLTSEADPLVVLDHVLALYAEASRRPIPLFPETSLAAVATALGRRPDSQWRGRDGTGEADRLEHRLLYPVSSTDILEMDDGALPFAHELTAIVGSYEIEDLTQARRCHDGTGSIDDEAAFTPLVGGDL